jgi:hypothetical protein
MEIKERYVLEWCQIIESTKVIAVRSRKQKWIVSGNEEMLVENNAGIHRTMLAPGDWIGANKWGVRQYADLVWTEEVISVWLTNNSQSTNLSQGT